MIKSLSQEPADVLFGGDESPPPLSVGLAYFPVKCFFIYFYFHPYVGSRGVRWL